MTPQEQRIAIAQACGWKKNDDPMLAHCYPEQMTDPVTGHVKILPDYLNDLNAMHEAEKAVIFKDVKLYLKYAGKLEKSIGGLIDAIFATAAQRAEEFLRVLGLWKE